jgi:putative membrane protein
MDCSLSETDLAKKAAERLSREDVRKFANQLIADHKNMTKELVDLARDQKIAVAAAVSKEHHEAMIKLLTNKGEDLDKQFLNHMVRSHQDAILVFETNANSSNREVAAFAERYLPILRRHLTDAKALGGTAK